MTDALKTRITILGSGTCVPSLRRSSCAVLMTIGSTTLVFDVGPGTMRRLLETGTTLYDLDMVCLSHFHPDHSGELAPLLFSTKYAGGERQGPLSLIAGTGFADFWNRLTSVYGDWIELPQGLLQRIEVTADQSTAMQFKGFSIRTRSVSHRPESLAFRVTVSGGISMVYSGDTDFSEDLVALSEEVDYLICESSFPEKLRSPGHMTPALAGRTAARAGAKCLVLTHFYPPCDHADIAKECRSAYNGRLILAEDLMEIYQ